MHFPAISYKPKLDDWKEQWLPNITVYSEFVRTMPHKVIFKLKTMPADQICMQNVDKCV